MTTLIESKRARVKCLFAVRDRDGNWIKTEKQATFFAAKEDAKAHRDDMNSVQRECFVTRGPDHWLGVAKVNNGGPT